MLPFILSVMFVFFVLPGFSVAEDDNQSFKSLKFAYDGSSFISFQPNMNPLTERFSACLWIKRLQAGNGSPFAYNKYEIFMVDDGRYSGGLFGNYNLHGNRQSTFPPKDSWYSYCITWSLASRTSRIYINGKLVNAATTPSGRKLQTGGTLVLGNHVPNGGHKFGGELYNFNVFSKELTATEVANLSTIGLCTEIPEHLEEFRVIRWEDILKLSRSGTVTDFVDPRCAAAEELQRTHVKLELAVTEKSDLELSLNKTKTELTEVGGLFNSTQEELVGVQRDLEATQRELNETKVELEDTKLDLEDTKSELKNVSDSRCALVKGNLTKWDIFYTPDYYNKIFTRRLYQQLRESWDSLSSQLFGVTMTDKIIKLIKNLDDEQNCGEL